VIARPLQPDTWDAFAALAERNDGVWGGCWCMAFHPEGSKRDPGAHRADKLRRVNAGEAHAALVFDAEACVGWCTFGPPDELPRTPNRKAYEAGLRELPDWRVTCFFVDRGMRRRGVAAAGLAAALGQIAALGGGVVEGYPEDAGGRRVASSFLFHGTVAMFEAEGFERVRRIGKHRWVVAKQLDPRAWG
jgi:GNAT superfamily N-acetyltransferase